MCTTLEEIIISSTIMSEKRSSRSAAQKLELKLENLVQMRKSAVATYIHRYLGTLVSPTLRSLIEASLYVVA